MKTNGQGTLTDAAFKSEKKTDLCIFLFYYVVILHQHVAISCFFDAYIQLIGLYSMKIYLCKKF